MGAESMLSEPPEGSLGARLGASVTIDLTDVDTAHLLAEHRALAAAHRQLRADYNADLELLIGRNRRLTRERDELLELVARADNLLGPLDHHPEVEAWQAAASLYVGEAT